MKHSWQDKLDEKGLEVVRLAAKLNRIPAPKSVDMNEWNRWLKAQKGAYSGHPDLGEKRKVKLDPEFVRAWLCVNPDIDLQEAKAIELFNQLEVSGLRAEELEMHQRIFRYLESNKNRRFEIYGAVASALVLFPRFFADVFRKQFGSTKPGLLKLGTGLIQIVKWFGNAMRGNIKEPPGRVNIELAGLVDAILEHQKEPLTQLELYYAVKEAGAQVPEDPEAFRLWLHRARKQGLVKKPARE